MTDGVERRPGGETDVRAPARIGGKSPSHGRNGTIGPAVQPEIVNVVDPNFTMVAKVRNALLPGR
ncbi:MAG: hypothetical protein OEW19_11145 [Acidobacteriota bacterium]|nr:hypothetical protein [Acidobacteriota bacterium]